MAAILGLIGAVAIGYLAFRPARVLGVNGGAIQCSIDCQSRFPDCTRDKSTTWQCLRETNEHSGDAVRYRVSISRSGCWHGVPVWGTEKRESPRVSGCLSILDYIRGSAWDAQLPHSEKSISDRCRWSRQPPPSYSACKELVADF